MYGGIAAWSPDRSACRRFNAGKDAQYPTTRSVTANPAIAPKSEKDGYSAPSRLVRTFTVAFTLASFCGACCMPFA